MRGFPIAKIAVHISRGILMPMYRMALIILLLVPFPTHAALMYLDPAEGTYGPGDTFIVNVRLAPDECVNATHVEITYPRETLRAVDFSRGGSILTLFVEEPKLDADYGLVTFSGGIPGGYCGRIAGDPVLSNILGKIVFSVVGTASEAPIRISGATKVHANDGEGTEVPLTTQDALITIAASATQSENPWIEAVQADSVPPEAFDIEVQSTRDVFQGNYYIVFSTVDKQSGMDHFEIFERGVWKVVASPYELRDQSLNEAIEVKAIDKAGNERFGVYDPSQAPERQSSPFGNILLILAIVIFVLGGAYELYRLRRRSQTPQV